MKTARFSMYATLLLLLLVASLSLVSCGGSGLSASPTSLFSALSSSPSAAGSTIVAAVVPAQTRMNLAAYAYRVLATAPVSRSTRDTKRSSSITRNNGTATLTVTDTVGLTTTMLTESQAVTITSYVSASQVLLTLTRTIAASTVTLTSTVLTDPTVTQTVMQTVPTLTLYTALTGYETVTQTGGTVLGLAFETVTSSSTDTVVETLTIPNTSTTTSTTTTSTSVPLPDLTSLTLTNNSGGTLTNDGIYQAGTRTGTVDTVVFTGANGNQVTLYIAVGYPLAVTPPAAQVQPGGTVDFSATAGSGLTYSLLGNQSGAVLTTNGNYRAGATANTVDVVKVTDSAGNIGFANIAVGSALSLQPSNPTVQVGGTQTFTATGLTGTPLFALAADGSGGATIDPTTGVYTAGANAGTDAIVVADDTTGYVTLTLIQVTR